MNAPATSNARPRSSRLAPALVIACCASMAMNALLLLQRRPAPARRASDNAAMHPPRQPDWTRDLNRLEHDLRTPVGAMAVAIELLKNSDDESTRREAVEVLERQVARMTSLAEELRVIARDAAPPSP